MDSDQPKECPKCRYVRRPDDTAPTWQCPDCGIAYDKYAGVQPASAATTQAAHGTAPKPPRHSRFKVIRVFMLAAILVVVAADAWLTKLRTTSWDHPLRVVVYPINGDGSEAATQYIAQLNEARFDGIEQWVKTEAARYGVSGVEPINMAMAEPGTEIPPLPPRGGNMFQIMWWSLKLRLWAHGADHYAGPTPEVRAFALYYDPATHPLLEHSTGLQKGMIGIIKLFATPQMAQQNDMVMLHEVLHTLGATDKYDLQTNQPLYPDGYADPDLQPRLPQLKAEVMAGRMPLSASRAEMPDRLSDMVIGAKTALEIGWIKTDAP